MIYQTSCKIVNKNSEQKLYDYCQNQCEGAKLLKNATIFRCRQLLFAHDKQYKDLLEHQIEVIKEFNDNTTDVYKKIGNDNYLPSANQFQKMYERTKNQDYYNPNLAAQTSIQIVRKTLNDFKSFFASAKDYSNDSTKYTGRPQLPKYIKTDETTATFTNQDCVIYDINNKTYLKLPNMKEDKSKKLRPNRRGYVKLGNFKIAKLMQVEIQPYYDTYKICMTYLKEEDSAILDENRILGIDTGVNNFLATSNNCGLFPFIIDGREMKSYNRYYNKTLARLRSKLPKGQHTSERIQRLSRKRDCYFNDKFHKIIHYLITYCTNNNIGVIVIGHNKFQKQNYNKGRVQNQNMCYLPHAKFIQMLKLKCETCGIKLIDTEESYTSKASFLDMDKLEVYGKETQEPKYSGRRKHRGFYEAKDGTMINADVNGASNIIRKVFPDAFKNINNFDYLLKTVYKIYIK